MTEADLDKELNQLLIKVRKIYREDSRMIHFRSLSNFIHTLTSEQETIPVKKNYSNRVALGRLRKKELILEYLERLLIESEVTEEVSDKYFSDFIKPLGIYMSSYHKFSYAGGGALFLKFASFLTTGIFLDYLLLLITGRWVYLTILILILFSLRYYGKYKQKRVFGYRY
ncbi:hypothetical protein [Salinimicrobium sp. GXAS 041]|uniref:hypothetical protein n=1 Tax=Salinimicrobium sp. GXAS 041 TaxID=3400806 RepID=UPI003C791754